MNNYSKSDNLYLSTKLGFGVYRDKRISDFDNNECDYLLWALKNVRMPKLLWDAIIEHLNTKVIINTRVCIEDKTNLTAEELEEFSNIIKLDYSLFLPHRTEPNIEYQCTYCSSKSFGYPEGSYISDNIRCKNCNNILILEDEELRFYFGWYKGWRIKDFEIKEDKEYLQWIITNVEHIPPRFKNGIVEKIKEKS